MEYGGFGAIGALGTPLRAGSGKRNLRTNKGLTARGWGGHLSHPFSLSRPCHTLRFGAFSAVTHFSSLTSAVPVDSANTVCVCFHVLTLCVYACVCVCVCCVSRLTMSSTPLWRFGQCFGEKDAGEYPSAPHSALPRNTRGFTPWLLLRVATSDEEFSEADVLSAVSFDKTGNFLATGESQLPAAGWLAGCSAPSLTAWLCFVSCRRQGRPHRGV